MTDSYVVLTWGNTCDHWKINIPPIHNEQFYHIKGAKLSQITGCPYVTTCQIVCSFSLEHHEVLALFQHNYYCKFQKSEIKATPFLFVGLRYPLIWKIEIWKKKIGSETNWWEISKYRHTFVPLKKKNNLMLLVCQILNICNEVLFDLIYQKMVTCKCYPSSEKYST